MATPEEVDLATPSSPRATPGQAADGADGADAAETEGAADANAEAAESETMDAGESEPVETGAEAARPTDAGAEAADGLTPEMEEAQHDPEFQAWERRRQRQMERLEQMEKGKWPGYVKAPPSEPDPVAEAAEDAKRREAVAKLAAGKGSTPTIAAAIVNAVAKAIKAGSIPPQWVREGWPSPAGPKAATPAAAPPPASAPGETEPKIRPLFPPPPEPKPPRGKIATRLRAHLAAVTRECRGLRSVGKSLACDYFCDWLLAQYIAVAHEMAEASETGSLTLDQLAIFTKALTTLQRGQHSGYKLMLEEIRVEIQRDSTGRWMAALFEKHLNSEEIKARFRPPPVSPEERERRMNAIFGYEGTPEHIMRKARQQVRAADRASAEAMSEVIGKGGTYEEAEEAGHSAAEVVIQMRIKDVITWGEYGICDAPILEELQSMGITDPDLLARAKPGRKLPEVNAHMYTLEGEPYKSWE